MTKNLNTNPELKLAFDFVQFTGKNIFLTGRAGTGKTTFLHTLKELSPKRMIVVAPTGVAAINAKGVTIHSFFQLAFGPRVPGYAEADLHKAMRFSKQKRNIIKSLDLLVIDEISMVRADLLDGIDDVLRRFRQTDEPFGGVQMLMIGDMQQLPPVVKYDEWNILKKYYDSSFFFSSHALQKTNYVTITLQHVYRQRDQHFIDVLNKIRDKQIDQQTIDILNDRYKPDFGISNNGYIILTTHNAKAKAINDKKLIELKVKKTNFKAEIKGSFPEYIYPTEIELELKVGAQVMFVKNDPEAEKRFYNGKIGVITEINKEQITVKCPEDEDSILVTPIEWQNIKYAINEQTKEINESIEGTFTQIPLKLAWAITIHKSQGLTFEKAVIDSEAAFAHGQVYVALSRCRSLEGLVLSTRFSPLSLKQNKPIDDFIKLVDENQPDEDGLEASKAEFQQKLLADLFTFSRIQNNLKWFVNSLYKNSSKLPENAASSVNEIKEVFGKTIIEVSEKFRSQINSLLEQNNTVEQNEDLQDRIKKASKYFQDQIKNNITSKIDDISFETDNKEVKKQIKNSFSGLQDEISYKMECLQSCHNGFSVKNYLNDRARAGIETTSKNSSTSKGKLPVNKDVNNPEFYKVLKQWRDTKVKEMDLPHYMILSLKSMRALSNQAPSNTDELKMVHGFGKKKLESFGEEILELINDYCKNHEVKIERPEIIPKKEKPKKGASKHISFELWQEHKDVEKVAKARDLAISTIFGHLSFFISTGELSAHDFVDKKKLETISTFLEKNPDMTLGEAKQKFGDDYTYNDLKFVQQHLNFLSNKNKKE